MSAKQATSTKSAGYGAGLDDHASAAMIDSNWGDAAVVQPQKRIAAERKANRTAGERKRRQTRTKRIEMRVEPSFQALVTRVASAMAEQAGAKRTNTNALEAGLRMLADKLGVEADA